MMRDARARAEERFAKLTRQPTDTQSERDQADAAAREKTARLKALRLAKEEAEKADKQAAKLKRSKTAAR